MNKLETEQKRLEDFEELLTCIAGLDALNLAFYLKGRSEETMNDVLFYYTGYRSYDQYCEENMGD